MNRYALKGINDDQHECAVCGRIELKRVMWLVALDADGNEAGDPFHVGTTCGAKLLGYTTSKMTSRLNKIESSHWRRIDALARQHPSHIAYEASLRDAQAKNLNFFQRQEAGLLDLWRQLQAEAQAWAEAQPMLIEL